MFEWDEAKNKANIAKHGVSFEQAAQMFAQPVLSQTDDRADYGEVRQISLGMIEDTVCLVVVHTDRNGKIRIISARRANRTERKRYEEAL